jgi:endonuclease/exonuclease/phosphatase family metal-dependent hydrolase
MPVLRACGLCVLWLSALLVASARWTWAGEVLCHFGPFLALFGLALALTCLLAKEPRRALSCLPASLLLGFPFLELRLAAVPEGAPGPTLEVASANLLWGSGGGEQLLAWLASGGPELLFLCELDPDTRARLLELEAAGYGFRFVWPPPEQWTPETIGRALLSKRPLTEPRVHWPGPLLEAQFELDGRPLHVFGAHPLRPGRPSFTRERNQTLARLAELCAETPACLVLGDLNSTEASPHFQRLLTNGRLSDTRAGRGWFPTWRAYLPELRWPLLGLRLPLDHVLTGPALTSLARNTGPDLGSDHLPASARIAWRPVAPREASEAPSTTTQQQR